MPTAPELADAERRATLRFAELSLSPLELELWYRAEYAERMFLRQGDALELVTTSDGNVEDIRRYAQFSLSASFRDGLKLHVREQGGAELVIGHAPRVIPGYDIFVWLPPYRPDFRHTLTGSSINLAYRAMLPPNALFGTTSFLRKA